MHPSSRENMKKARSKIEQHLGKDLDILDLGGRDIKPGQDRTYYPQWADICKNYYIAESVGIATGFLITALHKAGLATLTHTPSPMKFLNPILERPDNERPFILMVVGYAAADARVPRAATRKKALEEITSFR